MKEKVWLSSPHMGGDEQKFVKEAFDTNWVAPLGPNVDGFERELCRTTGAGHAAALSSGTAAIHLSMIISDIGPGDFVLCQSFTFSATANPIVYQGATPVFIDSEPGTWNMDPGLLEEAIVKIRSGSLAYSGERKAERGERKTESGKRIEESGERKAYSGERRAENGKNGTIKAIVPVHLYGMPAMMDEITAIAKRYNLPVIEDAAEALGSTYNGRFTGTFGRLGVLSFNGNKIITTSGGGALLSEDESLIKKARFLATQARDQAPYYQHSQIGYNYRMSNITAGIGRGQLEVLQQRVKRRREINQWYRDLLRDVPGVTFQTEPSDKFFSNHWLTTIIIDPVKSGHNREEIRLTLAEENIESRPLWKPMHLQPVFAKAPRFLNGTSEYMFNNGLCLPSGSNLKDSELQRIKDTLKRAFNI